MLLSPSCRATVGSIMALFGSNEVKLSSLRIVCPVGLGLLIGLAPTKHALLFLWAALAQGHPDARACCNARASACCTHRQGPPAPLPHASLLPAPSTHATPLPSMHGAPAAATGGFGRWLTLQHAQHRQSTFETSRRNACNIRRKQLKY